MSPIASTKGIVTNISTARMTPAKRPYFQMTCFTWAPCVEDAPILQRVASPRVTEMGDFRRIHRNSSLRVTETSLAPQLGGNCHGLELCVLRGPNDDDRLPADPPH